MDIERRNILDAVFNSYINTATSMDLFAIYKNAVYEKTSKKIKVKDKSNAFYNILKKELIKNTDHSYVLEDAFRYRGRWYFLEDVFVDGITDDITDKKILINNIHRLKEIIIAEITDKKTELVDWEENIEYLKRLNPDPNFIYTEDLAKIIIFQSQIEKLEKELVYTTTKLDSLINH